MTPLHELASTQLGLVSYSQCRQSGMSPTQIRHKVDIGQFIVVRRGVFLHAGAPPLREHAVLAAILAIAATGKVVVASHMTAAALWMLWRASLPPTPTLTIAGETRARLRHVDVRTTRTLRAQDCRRAGSIPVTSAARTICDIAGAREVTDIGHVIDDAIRRRITTLPDVVACFGSRVAQAPNAPGLAALRVALAKRSSRVSAGGSRAELDLWEILEPSGLPMPTQQFVVIIDGKRYVLDYAWPQWKIALEYDSWAFHEGTLRDHVRDRNRISELNLAGWLYLGATEQTTPRKVLRMVSRAIEQRTGQIWNEQPSQLVTG